MLIASGFFWLNPYVDKSMIVLLVAEQTETTPRVLMPLLGLS